MKKAKSQKKINFNANENWNLNQLLIYEDVVNIHICIYRIFDLENEMHSIWILWTNDLYKYKGKLFFLKSGGTGNIFWSGSEINQFFFSWAALLLAWSLDPSLPSKRSSALHKSVGLPSALRTYRMPPRGPMGAVGWSACQSTTVIPLGMRCCPPWHLRVPGASFGGFGLIMAQLILPQAKPI